MKVPGSSWHSYPKVWNLGHKKVIDIFQNEDHVIMQEKYNGSQFSFGVFDGKLRTRSRRQEFNPDEPPKLFQNSVEHVRSIQGKLVEGWTYRSEAIGTRRHNTLEYGRTPKGFLVLYDIEVSESLFMGWADVQVEASQLGVEYAMTHVVENLPPSMDDLKTWLDTESTLGDVHVEGVVFKNYDKTTEFGHVMMAKFVSEAFKEKHRSNPTFRKGKDFMAALGENYRTEARWQKAVEHLRAEGRLEDDPRDIGQLMKEINIDFEEECREEIQIALWNHFRKDVIRHVTKGMPEWYKEQLAAKVLE